MPRVIGVDIPGQKRLVISLTYLYGIGPHLAVSLIEEMKLDPDMKARDLSSEHIVALTELLQSGKYIVEGSLRRSIQDDIRRLRDIGSYRGRRHAVGLPVRGQSTATNARTRKGKKKTVMGKKKPTK